MKTGETKQSLQIKTKQILSSETKWDLTKLNRTKQKQTKLTQKQTYQTKPNESKLIKRNQTKWKEQR